MYERQQRSGDVIDWPWTANPQGGNTLPAGRFSFEFGHQLRDTLDHSLRPFVRIRRHAASRHNPVIRADQAESRLGASQINANHPLVHQPSISFFIMWSATRSAWDAIVSAGLTADDDGKNDESTT